MKTSQNALVRMTVCCQKLIAFSLLTSFVAASPLCAQSQKWDTSFIAHDTYYMVGVNVQHLLDYEKEDSELRKLVSEMLQQGMGIKAEELKQFQFLMGGEVAEGEDDENMLQIKLIFSEPQEFDSLLKKMFRGGEHEIAEHQGMKYFKSANKRYPSLYAPTNKEAVIANDIRLLTLMESEKSMGDFVERIKQADGNADLFLTFDYNDMTDRIVGQMAKGMKGLPFDIQDIAAEAKQGSLTVDLADDKPLIATIEANDQDGVERLKRAADALVALGKTGIPQLKKTLDAQAESDFGDEELAKSIKAQIKIAQQGLDDAEAALAGTTVESKGNQLEIKVTVMGGSVDGARALVQSMFGLRRAVRAEAVPVQRLDKAEIPTPRDK